jgi:hypothetical protein
MKPMVFGASFFGCEHPLMRAFEASRCRPETAIAMAASPE